MLVKVRIVQNKDDPDGIHVFFKKSNKSIPWQGIVFNFVISKIRLKTVHPPIMSNRTQNPVGSAEASVRHQEVDGPPTSRSSLWVHTIPAEVITLW